VSLGKGSLRLTREQAHIPKGDANTLRVRARLGVHAQEREGRKWEMGHLLPGLQGQMSGVFIQKSDRRQCGSLMSLVSSVWEFKE
jgi:hypothetical protein